MKVLKATILFLCIISFFSLSIAKEKGLKKTKNTTQQELSDNPTQSVININNITNWVSDNGFHNWEVSNSWCNEFPKGKNIGVIFSEGIVWGAKVNDGNEPLVRVNGNTYGSGCVAISRLYRVRPDYKNGNLYEDAASFYKKDKKYITDEELRKLREQYEKDWNEWPAELGAAYIDVNNNGVYEPEIDIPGIPGASQTIFIKYDDSKSLKNYGSPPIGLEITETYWAYSNYSKLDNVIFKKVDIVYKGTDSSAANSTLDSMYITQWVDPDVGAATDDLVGCDTLLNLGFAFTPYLDNVYVDIGFDNASAGYDFLQGVSKYTGNPADSAVFNLRWRKGYKYVNPKPMSSFIYFAAGGLWNDPSFSYSGTLEFYNLMRGKKPNPHYPGGEPYPESIADVTPFGTFLVDGDPIAKTGKIDGKIEKRGDRRMMLINGPFTMELGDTVQAVIALMAADSKKEYESITTLKTIDVFAQESFDNTFKNINVPSPPSFNVTLKGESTDATLEWEQNTEVESFDEDGYTFQGYNVYQVSDTKNVLLATFDKIDGVKIIKQSFYNSELNKFEMKDVRFGTDSGLKYNFKIEKDYANDSKLLKGRSYYFAVTAYSYNDDSVEIKSTESLLNTVELKYRGSEEGLNYGDTLSVKQISGIKAGNKKILVSVYDPDEITGEKYRINFFLDTLYNKYLWRLTKENGTIVLDSIRQMRNESESVIVDGLKIFVKDNPVGIDSWNYTGGRWVSGYYWGGKQFFGGMDVGSVFFWGSNITDVNKYTNVKLEWAGVTNRSDGTASALAANSKTEFPDRWSKGAVYRRDLSYKYDGIADIPFAAYDTKANPERRLNIVIVEDSVNGSANKLWDMGWVPYAFSLDGGREYIFIMASDYDEGAIYNDGNLGFSADVLYAIWPKNRGTRPYLDSTFTMNIIASKPFTENDVFEIKSDELLAINNNSILDNDYKLYQNYPNPFNPTTTIEYHIPAYNEQTNVTSDFSLSNVELKVYDILGRKVATLVNKKQKPGSYKVQFNANNLSSGIYFYRLTAGDFSKTKKLILLK